MTLQVCNAGGCTTQSVTVIVQAPAQLEPPVINLIGCGPLAVQVDDEVSCEPVVTGEVDTYVWEAGVATGDGETFSVAFGDAGEQTIELTACNGDGCDTATAAVEVSVAPVAVPPSLSLTPALLNFGSVATERTLTIGNSGGQSLNWSLSAPAWLLVSPGGGSVLRDESDGVTVTVNRALLGSGATAGQIQVSTNVGQATVSVLVTKPDVVDPVVVAPGDIELFVAWDQVGLSSGDDAVVAWLDGASATDDLDGVLAVANSAPDPLPIGASVVVFSATDEAGNTGTAQATVTVTALVQPPIVTVTCATPVFENAASACSVTSNTGGAITTYAWSDDGGGGGGSGSTYGPTFATAGPYTVTLLATNAGGSGGDTASVTVTVP